MSRKARLPRGIQRRDNSLICVFALPGGKKERRSVGKGMSVQQAAEQRAIWMREVREGIYLKRQPLPVPAPLPEKGSFTVADLWRVYLVDYTNRSNKDSSRLKIAWNHLRLMFESVHVQDLTTGMVNEYIASRREACMGNGTINRETALLSAMFHLGTRQTPVMVDRIPVFPKRLIEPPARKGFVTDKEYAVLARNAKPLWLRALIALAYAFGFRRGELLNLRVRQVDLMDRLIQLEEGTTKNNEARKIPMTSEVYELVRECISGKTADSFVFTRADGQHVVDPRDEWYSLCVSSGLGKFVPAVRKNGEKFLSYTGLNLHDFRRSAIRNMTRRGVNQTIAMRISGHKTASVFRRYDIVDERDLAEAAHKIEAGRQVDFCGSQSDTKVTHEKVAHS